MPSQVLTTLTPRTSRRITNTKQSTTPQRTADKSGSRKIFYVNDELKFSKDINTPFHSPYKGGRKDPTYTNPTFISSHLFYPQSRESAPVPSNLVLNAPQAQQRRLQALRAQRLDQEARQRFGESQVSNTSRYTRNRVRDTSAKK